MFNDEQLAYTQQKIAMMERVARSRYYVEAKVLNVPQAPQGAISRSIEIKNDHHSPIAIDRNPGSIRIRIYIWLRELALWVYGYKHFGGGFDEDTMTIYARKRKAK